jgi:hypothetical protein
VKDEKGMEEETGQEEEKKKKRWEEVAAKKLVGREGVRPMGKGGEWLATLMRPRQSAKQMVVHGVPTKTSNGGTKKRRTEKRRARRLVNVMKKTEYNRFEEL